MWRARRVGAKFHDERRAAARDVSIRPISMDQKRFILAAALSLGVILVWQKFFAPKPPQPEPNQKSAAGASPDAGMAAGGSADAGGSSTESAPTAGRDRPAADAGSTAPAGATATGPDAGATGPDAGEAGDKEETLTEREDRAWGLCLATIPKKLDVTQSEVEMPWPDPSGVRCGDGECTVSAEVSHRGSDETTPFTCVTRDGTVVSFDRSRTETEGTAPGAPPAAGGKPRARRDVAVETHVMESERVRLELTNARTGRLTSIRLLEPEQYQKEGDLLGAFPKGSTRHPFGIQFTNDTIPLPEKATFAFVEDESVSKDGGETWEKLTYRYEDPKGRFVVDRVFQWSKKDKYVLKATVEVENLRDRGDLSDTMALDIYGYKDPDKETSFLNFRPDQVKGVCRMAPETKRWAISEMEGPVNYDGSEPLWAAIESRYFMTGAVPKQAPNACSIETVGKGYLRTRLTYDGFSVLAGESKTLQHKLYLGPKDLDVLNEVGHKLSSSVDFGLFAFIAKPLHWGLGLIQTHIVSNWGLAIILLTVLIKLVTWPINMKAYRNMEDMKEIQPKLEEIRDKYEDDQQRMTEETMKLFRENDVSPMGGCLPMLLQMPILYGLYVMIYASVELYHAEFIFWYTNLAAPDPYYVLPILMGVVMFVQQGMMTSAGGNMQAKIMSKVMPFMFTGFMLFLPSGLVLYYSTNLIIGLGQQFYIRGFELPFGDSGSDPGES